MAWYMMGSNSGLWEYVVSSCLWTCGVLQMESRFDSNFLCKGFLWLVLWPGKENDGAVVFPYFIS